MASKQRVKGFNYERALVKLFNDCPDTYSERMWGSNGKSKGLSEKVDIEIDHFSDTYHVQCKNYAWKNLPVGFKSYCMDILEDVQMGITKVEGKHLGASLVIMELDTLLKLFRHPL